MPPAYGMILVKKKLSQHSIPRYALRATYRMRLKSSGTQPVTLHVKIRSGSGTGYLEALVGRGHVVPTISALTALTAISHLTAALARCYMRLQNQNPPEILRNVPLHHMAL